MTILYILVWGNKCRLLKMEILGTPANRYGYPVVNKCGGASATLPPPNLPNIDIILLWIERLIAVQLQSDGRSKIGKV